jgi:hypothetical protein
MKSGFLFFTILLSIFFIGITNAQVTNLMVNGVSSNFSAASGGTLTWSYNVPVGAATYGEIWYDVNQNGVIDPGDILYMAFTQVDGVANGKNGPGDGDGLANGIVTLTPTVIGIAPGMYILTFTQNASVAIIKGTVTPLLSPSHSLSGNIKAPSGKSAANCIVEVSRNKNYSPNSWDAISDINGNYTIQMNADTAGNPWNVYVSSNPYPVYIVSPAEIPVTINGNPNGLNFTISLPAAQIAGLIKDDNGIIQSNQAVDLMGIDNSNNTNFHTMTSTDANGIFRFGLAAQNIVTNDHWRVWAGNDNDSGNTTDRMAAIWNISSLITGDSLFSNMTVYYVNTQISGVVKYNGNIITTPVQIIAADKNQDIVESSVSSQNGTGNFTIPVTNKLFPYKIGTGYLGWGGYVYANPGDVNVILNITSTGVGDDKNGIPATFNLNQNYPNPFNPSTSISYQLPLDAMVTIKIFNLLGIEVQTLANGYTSAGSHQVLFNANGLSSGIYFYTVQANSLNGKQSFRSTKKMILMK